MRIVWQAIEEYPDYEINRMGQIRRLGADRPLKPFANSDGYLQVTLGGKNVKIHTLVAKTFLPNPEGLPVVNHKTGNKRDNRASQLEWCTYSENLAHAWNTGLRKKKELRQRENKAVGLRRAGTRVFA